LTTYRKYLKRVLGGDWLAFPLRLFNDTASVVLGERAIVLPADVDLLGSEANFGAFVEVEEIENVQLWPVQFWQRSVSADTGSEVKNRHTRVCLKTADHHRSLQSNHRKIKILPYSSVCK